MTPKRPEDSEDRKTSEWASIGEQRGGGKIERVMVRIGWQTRETPTSANHYCYPTCTTAIVVRVCLMVKWHPHQQKCIFAALMTDCEWVSVSVCRESDSHTSIPPPGSRNGQQYQSCLMKHTFIRVQSLSRFCTTAPFSHIRLMGEWNVGKGGWWESGHSSCLVSCCSLLCPELTARHSFTATTVRLSPFPENGSVCAFVLLIACVSTCVCMCRSGSRS